MDQITMLLQVFAPFVALFISAPFIQALVNMAKASGLKNEYAPWLAIGIGGFLGGATSFLVVNLVAVPFSQIIIYIVGIYLGLKEGASAAGFYDAAKTILAKPTEPTIINDETGSASIFTVIAIFALAVFIYLVVMSANGYGFPIYYYILASCLLVGYFIGLLSRFKYIKSLEKQLISARLEKM